MNKFKSPTNQWKKDQAGGRHNCPLTNLLTKEVSFEISISDLYYLSRSLNLAQQKCPELAEILEPLQEQINKPLYNVNTERSH